jgi:hypothetical protein
MYKYHRTPRQEVLNKVILLRYTTKEELSSVEHLSQKEYVLEL